MWKKLYSSISTPEDVQIMQPQISRRSSLRHEAREKFLKKLLSEEDMNGQTPPMMTMTLTGLITTMLIITLGIVDLCFVLFKGTGSSVSNFMIQAGFKSPMLVFAVGFICGHLFGMMKMVYQQPTKGA